MECSVAYSITMAVPPQNIAAATVALAAATATDPDGLGPADLAHVLDTHTGPVTACYTPLGSLSIVATGVAVETDWQAWLLILSTLRPYAHVTGYCLDDCGSTWGLGAPTPVRDRDVAPLAALLEDPARWARLTAMAAA